MTDEDLPNIDHLLTHLNDTSLAARFVQAHQSTNPEDAMKQQLHKRLEEVSDFLS